MKPGQRLPLLLLLCLILLPTVPVLADAPFETKAGEQRPLSGTGGTFPDVMADGKAAGEQIGETSRDLYQSTRQTGARAVRAISQGGSTAWNKSRDLTRSLLDW
ncbi:MAG: hypothetical protein OQL28_02890 [Sedimenticola sp.]|nr:hypothetical protein [Sedimenticola sp.]